MLYPKDLELPTPTPDNPDKVTTFVLSKFPAVAGREIVAKYPVSNMPKLGDYAVSEATMLKLMAFCGVRVDGRDEPLMLTSRALVDNHVGGWETLARLEWAMIEYNCSFFGNGLNSDTLAALVEKARPLISQMLTALSAQSSPADKPASEN
jgi:hypothetical protein